MGSCFRWLSLGLHRLGLAIHGPVPMGSGIRWPRYATATTATGRRVYVVGASGLVKIHELKSWPQFFAAIVDGSKTFELRKNDRGGFEVDDILRLREWDPITSTYSGRMVCVRVTYVLNSDKHCAVSPKALHPDYCVLGISQHWKNKTPIADAEGNWSYDR